MNTWQPYPAEDDLNTHSVTGVIRKWPDFWSPQLENSRDITVYLPPSYHTTNLRYPVIYMHDGQNLFDSAIAYNGVEWSVDEAMDTLSKEGMEAIIVGLDHGGDARITEYNPFAYLRGGRGVDYIRFIVETVKPQIDHDYRTLPGREHTGIMGSSMGGLISLYTFFHWPQVFGFAGVMSPSLWVGRGAIYEDLQHKDYLPGKIYLDNGTKENSAARLEKLLITKGYVPGKDLLYVVDVGGEHTESAWARRLPDALRFLLRR